MEPIKPDFSEANKFAVLKRGFRDEFDKAYKDFWRRRNMEAPDTSWFGDRKRRKEEMEAIKK
jgi:hypothetical protein